MSNVKLRIALIKFEATIAGMMAENRMREIQGFSPAHTEDAFDQELQKFENELKSIKKEHKTNEL